MSIFTKLLYTLIYWYFYFALFQIVDYNVQGGKMNRGIAVVESYSYLTDNVTEENLKIAIALGWAVELVSSRSFMILIYDALWKGYN